MPLQAGLYPDEYHHHRGSADVPHLQCLLAIVQVFVPVSTGWFLEKRLTFSNWISRHRNMSTVQAPTNTLISSCMTIFARRFECQPGDFANDLGVRRIWIRFWWSCTTASLSIFGYTDRRTSCTRCYCSSRRDLCCFNQNYCYADPNIFGSTYLYSSWTQQPVVNTCHIWWV